MGNVYKILVVNAENKIWLGRIAVDGNIALKWIVRQ
jgi:hypothetical protein